MLYFLRRLVSLGAVLLGALTLMFFLSHVLPGDPARVALGDGATQEMLERFRREEGLDQPLWVQYQIYMGKLLRGDLGRSIYTGRPVIQDLARFFPATLELTLFSTVLSGVVGISLGVLSAVNRGNLLDRLGQIFSLLFISLPIFWLGLIFQLVFFYWLRWLPVAFRFDPLASTPPQVTGLLIVDTLLTGNWSGFVSVISHLILPAVILSNYALPGVARITRASFLEVMSEPYVATARAKGLSTWAILRVHVFKNAAIPIVTVMGIRFGQSLGGAVVTESIFQWPGIGKYAFDAISRFDFPALMGSFLIAVAMYGVSNLLVDMLYFWLDPRLRRAS